MSISLNIPPGIVGFVLCRTAVRPAFEWIIFPGSAAESAGSHVESARVYEMVSAGLAGKRMECLGRALL